MSPQFKMLDRSGQPLLRSGRYVQAKNPDEAKQHIFDELDGQYLKDEIEASEVRVCNKCGYEDPATGADSCPSCGETHPTDT